MKNHTNKQSIRSNPNAGIAVAIAMMPLLVVEALLLLALLKLSLVPWRASSWWHHGTTISMA